MIPLLGLLLLAGVVVAIVLATGGSSKSHNVAAQGGNDGIPGIVDKPISFSVLNHNTTGIPCTPTMPDGKRYVLQASLVAPSSALAGQPRSVLVLISGIIISGDHLWRPQPGGAKDLDAALALAKRGQAVVTVGLLGYHGSVTASGPNGNQVCAEVESDVIHQVVQQLRSGQFQYGGAASGPSFNRVAIMAFSIGGEYTTAEVYSFHDVDGLVLLGSSPPNYLQPLAAKLSQSAIPDCKKQDRHKNADGTGPPGYTMASTALAQEVLFYDRDPRDNQVLAQGAEASPCGVFSSGLNLLTADKTGLPKITVPILLAFGQHDGLVGTAGAKFAIKHELTGSKDRTLTIFPGAGHAWPLERQRAKWLDMVAGWLQARGL